MTAESVASLVIIRKGQSVLLGRKKNAEIGTGKLNAPGGKQEEGENSLGCAVREVKEEVGLILKPRDLRHIGVLKCYVGRKPNHQLFQIVHVYYTEEFVGSPRRTASMVPEWVNAHVLPYSQMHAGDRYWFDLAARGERFRFNIWYERPGEGYIDHELLPY